MFPILVFLLTSPSPADDDVLFAVAQEESIASFSEYDGYVGWVAADQFEGETLEAYRALDCPSYAARQLAYRAIHRLGPLDRAKVAAWLSRDRSPARRDAGRMILEGMFPCLHCGGSGGCPTRAYCHDCARSKWLDPDEYGHDACRVCGASGSRRRATHPAP